MLAVACETHLIEYAVYPHTGSLVIYAASFEEVSQCSQQHPDHTKVRQAVSKVKQVVAKVSLALCRGRLSVAIGANKL